MDAQCKACNNFLKLKTKAAIEMWQDSLVGGENFLQRAGRPKILRQHDQIICFSRQGQLAALRWGQTTERLLFLRL